MFRTEIAVRQSTRNRYVTILQLLFLFRPIVSSSQQLPIGACNRNDLIAHGATRRFRRGTECVSALNGQTGLHLVTASGRVRAPTRVLIRVPLGGTTKARLSPAVLLQPYITVSISTRLYTISQHALTDTHKKCTVPQNGNDKVFAY